MEKLINWFKQHHWFLLYLSASAVFLLCLNQWLWPTPDEYFYGLLANSFTAVWSGELLMQNVNTEHIALLSGLVAIYNHWFQSATLLGSRVVVIGFALGTVSLYYLLARTYVSEKRQAIYAILLLLLVPGFWVFSVRLMLDIPATFAIALILYLVIKRKPVLYVTVAVMLLLLFREYYVYLVLPFLVVVYAFEQLDSKEVWWVRLTTWFGQVLLVVLPTLILISIFLDLNLLPYPRLLENSLVFIFGDFYTIWHKFLLSLLNQLNAGFVFESSSYQAAQDAGAILAESTGNSASLADTIGQIQLTGTLPTGVVDSQIASVGTTIWQKLWLIYYYNFSEADVNVLLIPLACLGVLVRLFEQRRFWKLPYEKIRIDIIIGLFCLVFAYFNIHEANNVHGFRITLPAIFGILYFAYFGITAVLSSKEKWIKPVFVSLVGAAFIAYYITIRSVVYGSVLANDPNLALLLQLKPFIFILLYAAIVVYLLWYQRITWPSKQWVLPIVAVTLFVVKFFPFWIDAQKSQTVYGFDYGLPSATVQLSGIMDSKQHICGNVHPYKQQYYSQDPYVTNAVITPQVRYFSDRYVDKYFFCYFDETFYSQLTANQINYVLVVNDEFDERERVAWETLQAEQPERFTLLEDSYLNGRLQWALYQVD